MNLPLYSAATPAIGRKPGYGSYDERVHCHTHPVICAMPGASNAASHSASVGSRARHSAYAAAS